MKVPTVDQLDLNEHTNSSSDYRLLAQQSYSWLLGK